jgi:glucokinase
MLNCRSCFAPAPRLNYIVRNAYLAIEIGGTKLQLVLADESGIIFERRKISVEPHRGGEGIRAQIQGALPELLPEVSLIAVGVGFGGPVDWHTGKIARSHQIEGWSEFDLAGWLRPLVGAPVLVDNDANVAALGEARRGAGLGYDSVFYVTLGSGVGGGMITNGVIYHGATPGEAELGHIRLDRTGTTVESRCSGWAVDQRIRTVAASAPASLLNRSPSGQTGGEARNLAQAIRMGDSVAKGILEDTADDLAFGLSHVVHLFHPQVIIIGGGLSGVGESLRASVEGRLPGYVMKVFLPASRIVLAALGEDAVPIGALEMAKAGTKH